MLSAMRCLKARGLVVAFVSHHLAEIEAVADRLTILKDGRKVGDFTAGEIDREGIQTRMVGRELAHAATTDRATINAGAPVLRLFGTASTPQLKPLELSLHRGEIVGFAGLKGAGGERVLELAAGIAPVTAGHMERGGRPYRARTPAEDWPRGIGYLPGERMAEGLIADASVLDNLVMAAPPRRGPFFDRGRARATARELIGQLLIKTSSENARAGSLSGGNLQKVVLGKCVATAPQILLLNNPTRGVDVGARTEIYRTLRRAAAAGLAILVVSEDLNELIALSHRILVMRGGEVSTTVDNPPAASEDAIIRFMT